MKESWYVLPARSVGRALRAIEARDGERGEGPAGAHTSAHGNPNAAVLLVLMPEREDGEDTGSDPI